MAGISSKAAGIQENKDQKFQGQKFDDDLGLNWYQFKWRNHDPQIGRFIEVDPLSEKYVYNSTYAFSENKVTGHIELEGLEAVEANQSNNPYVRAAAKEKVQRKVDEANKNLSQGGSVTVSAGVGVGVEAKAGNFKVKAGVSGPQASVTMTPDGKTTGKGSLASADVGVSIPAGGVEGGVGFGNVENKDGKTTLTQSAAELKVTKEGGEAKVSNNGTAEVSLSVKLGVIGVKIMANPVKLFDGLLALVGTAVELLKSGADEKVPLSGNNRQRFSEYSNR